MSLFPLPPSAALIGSALYFLGFAVWGWRKAIPACVADYRADHVVRVRFVLATLAKPLRIPFIVQAVMLAFAFMQAHPCNEYDCPGESHTEWYPFFECYAYVFMLSHGFGAFAAVMAGIVKIFLVAAPHIEKMVVVGWSATFGRLPTIRW